MFHQEASDDTFKLITTVYLNEVKIPRNYPVPKCLWKQGTMNTNIIKERKMSTTMSHKIKAKNIH